MRSRVRSGVGIGTSLIGFGGVAIVVALAIAVMTGLTDPVDSAVVGAVRSPETATLFAPLTQITELGSTWAVLIVAVFTAALAAAIGPWLHGLAGALTIVVASLLNSLVKLAIARERPDLLEPLIQERGYSFPSGHAALGMVAYGVLAVVIGRSQLPRAIRIGLIGALLVLVGLIGLSRVWLGYHYPTDVIAGWTAGAVIVLIYLWLTRPIPREPADGAPPV